MSLTEQSHKTQTKTKKELPLTCLNKACRKAITKPIKILNLQGSSRKPYNACPYCLTEITATVATVNDNKNPPEKNIAEDFFPEETPSQKQKNSPNCEHHFGYLNKKEGKQQIPEECLSCPQVIDCMKKRIR